MSEVKDIQEQPKVEIAVENFGPIAEANIDLRPLTVFVGPSNTGKTYFATLVYVLHGVFNGLSGFGLLSPFDVSNVRSLLGELLKNPAMSETEIQDLLKKLETVGRPFKLSDLPNEMHQKLSAIIKNTNFFREELNKELKNCFDLDSFSDLMRFSEGERNEMRMLLKFNEGSKENWNFKMNISESEIKSDSFTVLDNPIYKDILLLPEGWSISAKLIGDENSVHINSAGHTGSNHRHYLPAARSGIMQSHRIIASSLVKRITRVGLDLFPEVPTMSGVIADFMERIILYGDRPMYPEMKQLSEMLETEVLAGQILFKPSSSGYPDFRYLPHGSNEEFRLSQSSSMVSELAPLVLYFRSLVQPGDTLIIEEPEAHLHPGAQADMAVIFARLVRAGVRVIITTHSDWLLQEIGNLILEGELAKHGGRIHEPPCFLQKKQVGAWHFQKDGSVNEIKYDRIDGIEPQEYGDVAESLYNRSAELQNRLEEMKGNNISGG